MKYLPAYSPEFNPCELVFAKVKNILRHNRDFSIPMYYNVLMAFAGVSHENLVNYYNKCVFSQVAGCKLQLTLQTPQKLERLDIFF